MVSPPPAPKTSRVEPSGMTMADMFSTTPVTFCSVCSARVPERCATLTAACCGVETTTTPERGSSWPTEMAMSPVPGGRSRSRWSRSPKWTSVRNCSTARCSMGPRHATGWAGSTNMPIEITLTTPRER